MLFGNEFSKYLPELRQYARAICGTQEAGDELVVVALERLTKTESVPRDLAARPALYAILSDLLNSSFGEKLMRPAPAQTAAPAERQAFLLSALAGFEPATTARILSLPQSAAEKLLTEAYRSIARDDPANVFVIEDEFFIATDLEAILIDLGHRIAGLARTHGEAVAAMADLKPDLVLADIQLADGSSGIDAVHDILEMHAVPVIFITAYPERLLTGLRPEPTYLVTKPFSRTVIQASVSQALFNAQSHRARPEIS